MREVQTLLENKLTEHLKPVYLEVINESPNHNVPDGSESHFRVVIVSKIFEGLNTIKRHQKVYAIISQEIKEKIHAFSQHTLTPEEWKAKGGNLAESPPCVKK